MERIDELIELVCGTGKEAVAQLISRKNNQEGSDRESNKPTKKLLLYYAGRPSGDGVRVTSVILVERGGLRNGTVVWIFSAR